jgi:broad specificity phosphatase PhoE
MRTLKLIRHGQASTLEKGDYDKLSPLGQRQSQQLGAYWAAQNLVPRHIFVGPRRRHQGTYQHVLASMGDLAQRWPEPQPLATLDELPGEDLLRQGLPLVAKGQDALAARAGAVLEGFANDNRDVPEMLAVFRAIIEKWATDALTLDGVESWSEFRARVGNAMDEMTEATREDGTTLAFTSGGFKGVALGRVLGMNAITTVSQMWPIQNSSITAFRISDTGLTLSRFNTVPHLSDPAEHTLV